MDSKKVISVTSSAHKLKVVGKIRFIQQMVIYYKTPKLLQVITQHLLMPHL